MDIGKLIVGGAAAVVGKSGTSGLAPGVSIIHINKKKYYTNLSFSSVINDRIMFGDGSWFDVGTHEMRLNDGAYLSTEKLEVGEESVMFGPFSHQATCLGVKGLNAMLEIFVSDDPEMKVWVQGLETHAKMISSSVVDGVLLIEDQSESSSDSLHSIINSSVSISRSSGSSIISGGGNIDIRIESGEVIVTKVIVTVPLGTPLSINRVEGELYIEDVRGPLQLETSSSEKSSIGYTADTYVKSSDRGAVISKGVDGNLTAHLKGSGGLSVDGGDVKILTVKSTDRGSFHLDGDAGKSTITSKGSGSIGVTGCVGDTSLTSTDRGEISLGGVRGDLTSKQTGSGGVVVSGGHVGKLDVKVTDRGPFRLNASAGDALIVSDGSGRIDVSGGLGNTTLKSKDRGDISLGNVDGDLSAELTDSGSVIIGGGSVGTLKIKSDDRGKFELNADAQQSTITSDGSGSITVRGTLEDTTIKSKDRGNISLGEVNGDLTSKLSGSGSVTIGGGSVGTLHVRSSDRGKFNFAGRAVNADLKSSGSGDIHAQHVDNPVKKRATDRGKITVGNQPD